MLALLMSKVNIAFLKTIITSFNYLFLFKKNLDVFEEWERIPFVIVTLYFSPECKRKGVCMNLLNIDFYIVI